MAYYDVDDESRSRMPAYIARQDCERLNRENRGLYTPAQIHVAENFKSIVDDVFFRRRTFLNFREKFIAIKVEAPKKEDMVTRDYINLMAAAAANNITVKPGRASIIFQLKRK